MDYKHYYRDKSYEENEEHFKNIFGKRVKIVKKFSSKNGKVLEIGASTGAMLDLFKDDGWETWGVEPSETSVVARQKGHKIIRDYFEHAKLPKKYFDVVIANHTLEHMDNPVEVLKKIYDLLKTGGIVLIDVPNAGGIAARVLKDRWPYRLPKEHKQQFTKESLSKVFKDAGFEVIYFESRSGIFEFKSPGKEIWESLTGMKKRFFTNILNIPYDILVTVFGSGDSMSIVGRKM